jgi:nucleoid-associated protein YgaU
MSKLNDKYSNLIQQLQSLGVAGLSVREQDNVLYIDGILASESDKEKAWETYQLIDPDFRAGDLVLNLAVSANSAEEEYEVKKGDNLSSIGKKYGVSWKDIFEVNKDIISNPDLIQPGWKLRIPKK